MLRNLPFVFAVLAAGCATPPPGEPPPPLTLLISIDGFRPDYLDRGQTPVLSTLADQGVLAAMRPSFPTVTFPNHYTLVTGRRPDSHGIVSNRMEDAARPGVTFTLSNVAVSSDLLWWSDATPIWITAEQQGVRTATMFWPGSDFDLGGRPSMWSRYDQSLPDFARVDRLLDWLDVPSAKRPRFATLYFDIVDTAGHYYGPDAPETTSAVAQVDAAIGRLMEGLRSGGLAETTNVVIVSDHGMADVSEDRIISLDARFAPEQARVIWDGPVAAVKPVSGHETEVERALLGRGDHGECWRKNELPGRFQYGSHRRVPEIVCLADSGWRYRSSQTTSTGGRLSLGAHGFDPALPEMAALFLAHGPAFRKGLTLEPFDNVSVYPLIARLTGVEPLPNDGAIEDVVGGLR